MLSQRKATGNFRKRARIVAQGKRIPDHVRAHVAMLAALPGLTSKSIKAELDRVFGEDAPSERSVDTIVRAARQQSREPWNFAEADPDEARLVLPVYRALIEWWPLHPVVLTAGQAAWIAKIRRVAPDIPLEEAGRAALSGIGVAGPDGDTLRDFLAYAPWRSEADANAYTAAFNDRRIRTYRGGEWTDPKEIR
jgi:hypothetical protein